MTHEPEQTKKKQSKRPKFVRWALMVGIVIILNVFFIVVKGILFPAPQYSDFCPANQASPADQASCVTAGGTWNPQTGGAIAPTAGSTKQIAPQTPGGYCDMTSKCQVPYDKATKDFQGKSFVLMIGLGALALIVGMLPLGSSIVSTGLSYGGVLTFIIGSTWYWNDAPQLIQLGISALALGALVYTGLKHYRD
jgi:hypothetical protein